MSRKPHLVAMTRKALEEYKDRLLYEHVCVLVELGLREARDAMAEELQDVGPGDASDQLLLDDEPAPDQSDSSWKSRIGC